MTRLCTIILVPTAAVALVTLAAACGSYSSPASGAAGTQSAGAGTSSGATAGDTNGSAGTTGNSNGGTTGNPNGGTTGNPSGGAAGTGTGGSATTAGTGGVVGTAGAGGGSAGAGGGTGPALPCDILTAGGTQCVSAHSTVRVIVSGYTGPLYQLCKGTSVAGPSSCKGMTKDIGSKDGYADSAAHDAFCAGGSCTITKIYDQSPKKNDLEPAPRGGNHPTPNTPADAGALKVTINGHAAYGVLIKQGMGYRAGCSGCTVKTGNGMATGDAPETEYWITSQKDLPNGCCWDYGNAETTSNDDRNGTMETLNFGNGVVWGTGTGGQPGPWIEADLEDGLYAGWEKNQAFNISTNTPLKYDFVTGLLLGDTKDKNGGKGRFALYGGNAASGALQTMYDGVRPNKAGYAPMQKQGSIILGIGGDASSTGGGRFYEGAISVGPVISQQTADALQAAIVAAKYGQ